MPKVSVIMPCHNAVDTLGECLDSLFAQTYDDFEIIAVDDGSTDATLAYLVSRAHEGVPLKVLSQPHQGIIAALNLGLAASEAPFAARMDADDRAHPDRLEKQAAMLANNPDLTVVSCLVRGFPKKDVREGFRVYLDWLNALTTPEAIAREIYVESPLPHPSVMFRREAVTAAGGYQEHGWPEDYDLWLRLHVRGARFAKVPEVLLDWREHPDRLTRADSRYSLENFIRAKAHYLMNGGPVEGRDAVFIWGAGMMGRRISKYFKKAGLPLAAFIDIDPRKIGRTRRGKPIIPPEELLDWWSRFDSPILLAAVGARGARPLIRARLVDFGLVEGEDWWGVS